MDLKTHALDRLLEALSPSLAAELEKVAQETRETSEKEFRTRLESAVREAESAAAAAGQAQLERAVAQAKDETRRQVTAELEQQLRQKLEATTTQLTSQLSQLKNEAAEERSKLEAALTQKMTQQKNEWSGELSKLEDERDRWRTFAQTQKQLAEASSQSEMLSRFLTVAHPFAEGLAIYVAKSDGLALWKSKGKGAFPKIISKETTDPESYFRILSVRGKTVGAICAAPSFQVESLDFLIGTLERAIEAFGLRLRAPVPTSAVSDSR